MRAIPCNRLLSGFKEKLFALIFFLFLATLIVFLTSNHSLSSETCASDPTSQCILRLSLAAADEIESDELRDPSIYRIARALSISGNISEALDTISRTDNPYYGSLALIQIAVDSFASGRFIDAERILAEAASLVDQIDQDIRRLIAASKLSAGYAGIGNFERALNIASELEGSYHNIAMVEIADTLISESDLDQAAVVIDAIELDALYARLMSQIALRQFSEGNFDAANHTLDQSRERAALGQDPLALATTAAALVHIGEIDRSRELWAPAVESAARLRTMEERDMVLDQLLPLQMRFGDVDQVLSSLALLDTVERRDGALLRAVTSLDQLPDGTGVIDAIMEIEDPLLMAQAASYYTHLLEQSDESGTAIELLETALARTLERALSGGNEQLDPDGAPTISNDGNVERSTAAVLILARAMISIDSIADAEGAVGSAFVLLESAENIQAASLLRLLATRDLVNIEAYERATAEIELAVNTFDLEAETSGDYTQDRDDAIRILIELYRTFANDITPARRQIADLAIQSATDLAQRMPETALREDLLLDAIFALAAAGDLAQSHDLRSSISNQEFQDRSLYSIVVAQIENDDLERAIELSSSIQNSYIRSQSLYYAWSFNQ